MDALTAHFTMSTQALESDKVRSGLKDVLLGPAQLYEALRARDEAPPLEEPKQTVGACTHACAGGETAFRNCTTHLRVIQTNLSSYVEHSINASSIRR